MKKIIIALSVILFSFVFYTSNTSSVYATASGGWQATSLVDAPLGRADHTAIWTGKEMIIWGGMDGAAYLNSGGRYDPTTNSWKPTSLVNAPAVQSGHVSIWTGKEMIIWGESSTNRGAKYNPDTDSWKFISMAGAPSSRNRPSVVWTGTEMILWGGEGGANHVFGDGARYNPETDTWKPISMVGAPTARRYHKAVWTGTEMIVWGGSGFDEPTNSWPSPTTSARYNPSTDTWRSISLTNSPPQQNLPAIIWTGTEMIVTGSQNTVGRYNPNTDTWQNVSSVNAPNTGGFAGIVWTGKEVIVWGDISLNNNARYNPSLDSWSLLTKVNAPPSDRRQLTAVWTGEHMIVWGGSDTAGSYVNTGGTYSTPVCTTDNFVCGDWNSCSSSGQQTRTCNKVNDCDGGIAAPSTTQSCTYVPPACSSWTYSGWSSCSADGQQTRTITSSSPSGCAGGNPVLNQSCTYVPPCTASSWQCSDWNSCSADGKQTRACNKVGTCEGGVASPATTQSCTYVAPVCSTWTYSNWTSCSTDGKQTRSVISASPSSCTGGSPVISQSCTPPPPVCNEDTWSCGDWNQCSSYGAQSRSCTKSFDCPTANTSSPATSQNCTPPQPTCNADTWTCGDWGSCSPLGIQNRSCQKTFDCSSVEDAAPATARSCTASVTPVQELTQGESINREQILRATVKLQCPIDKTWANFGSGTVIDEYGTILTNKHVVTGTIGTCRVGFIMNEDDVPSFSQIADVKSIAPDLGSTNWNGDMALLKIRNPGNRRFIAVDIFRGNSSNLRSGDAILPFGYPDENLYGQTITFTEGPYSNKGTTMKVPIPCDKPVRYLTIDVSGYFKTTASIDHGNSGGGAYQKSTGYYMGMPTLGNSCNPNIPSRINHILSINTIKQWLSSLGSSYSVTQNNYTNLNNFLSSTVKIEEINLSNLRPLDAPTLDEVVSNKTVEKSKGKKISEIETIPKAPKVIEQPKVDQKTPKVVEKVQPNKPQEESKVIEATNENKAEVAPQQNQVEPEKEQKPKRALPKRFFSWLSGLFSRWAR